MCRLDIHSCWGEKIIRLRATQGSPPPSPFLSAASTQSPRVPHLSRGQERRCWWGEGRWSQQRAAAAEAPNDLKPFRRPSRPALTSARRKQEPRKQTTSKILVRNIPFQADSREIRELFR